jgi:hypothetical protein
MIILVIINVVTTIITTFLSFVKDENRSNNVIAINHMNLHPVVTILGGNSGEIITMCGHGLISRHLVEHLLTEIRNNRMTIEIAATELAKPCLCGIFNPKRGEFLLGRLLQGTEYHEGKIRGWTVEVSDKKK